MTGPCIGFCIFIPQFIMARGPSFSSFPLTSPSSSSLPPQPQVIGSSLLFVYDSTDLCSVHLIDFGKTISLPSGISIDHRSQWEEGNHEDGYLWGLDNLIELWRDL